MEHQTGKWKDDFTGLYYFWARWYDPEVGRFVKRDRIQCKYYIQPYTFSGNDPINFSDVDGNLRAKAEKYSNGEPSCDDVEVAQLRNAIVSSKQLLEKSKGAKMSKKLYSCLLNRYNDNEAILCSRCCTTKTRCGETDVDYSGVVDPVKGGLPPIGKELPHTFTRICMNNITSFAQIPHTLLHELGHHCGCVHPQEDGTGFTVNDYVESKTSINRCSALPYYCGEKFHP
ncbi:MAG: hypothetical protein H6752_10335 [Candidatus Omnitrophica bacterium]|nr:hypothetical protein [Candidatus Omnitrophota bacterium]